MAEPATIDTGEWSEESDRFLHAVYRLTFSAIEGEILRAKYECFGCSHARHDAHGCSAKPKFTGETKCACPMDTK